VLQNKLPAQKKKNKKKNKGKLAPTMTQRLILASESVAGLVQHHGDSNGKQQQSI
jgi:hypothetical protein